jgi:hypothetical protein
MLTNTSIPINSPAMPLIGLALQSCDPSMLGSVKNRLVILSVFFSLDPSMCRSSFQSWVSYLYVGGATGLLLLAPFSHGFVLSTFGYGFESPLPVFVGAVPSMSHIQSAAAGLFMGAMGKTACTLKEDGTAGAVKIANTHGLLLFVRWAGFAVSILVILLLTWRLITEFNKLNWIMRQSFIHGVYGAMVYALCSGPFGLDAFLGPVHCDWNLFLAKLREPNDAAGLLSLAAIWMSTFTRSQRLSKLVLPFSTICMLAMYAIGVAGACGAVISDNQWVPDLTVDRMSVMFEAADLCARVF